MKTQLLLVLFALLLQITFAQMPGQPDYVGLTQYNAGDPYVGPYATLFEPTGKYFLTTRHWKFNQVFLKREKIWVYNHELTFGNGQKSMVKNIHYFPGEETSSFDIAIGELETPVTGVTIPQIWWQMPQDLVNGEIQVTGWSYLNGWFTGSQGFIYFNSSIEKTKGLAYYQPFVQGGYSGAPILYQGKLLGINFGAYPDIQPYQGGWASLLFLVFQDYWDKFPQGIVSTPPERASLDIKQVGSVIEVILKSSAGNRLQMTASETLSQWIPVYEKSGFIESIPLSQWETIVRWNPSGQAKVFFNTCTRM